MKTKAANEKCVKLQLLTQKFISFLFDKERLNICVRPKNLEYIMIITVI